ncbi:MAG TPA: sigma factor [Luteimonas sp.]|nr:sigma factor [Luteimonas sp.]
MFHTTRWSMVVQTRLPPEQSRDALESLCGSYRPPVVAWLRAHGSAQADAEDLAQAFFEQMLLNRFHAAADPARGRFRSFLLTALKHFVANQREHDQALKRGGAAVFTTLDEQCDPADESHAAPDQAFERDYALTVIARAVARLRAEALRAGKAGLFDQVEAYLLEPPDPSEYAALADRLGMRRNTLAVAIHRLRNRLRDMVREELEDTVDGPAALEIEMAMLRKALSNPLQADPAG